jgi:hypothetical protein
MLALDSAVLPNIELVILRLCVCPPALPAGQDATSTTSREGWPTRNLYGRLDSAHVELN